MHSVNRNKVGLKHCVWESVFDRLKTENKVDNISLIASSVIASPCTIGMKEQYIVIPAYMVNLFEAEEIEMLLKHEFYHIARRDIPRKILVRMLNCLNWFNPLYILLRDNLSEWIETACDEAITKDFTIEQRLQYCRLLVKVMELESDMNEGNSFRSNFVTNNLKDLKRRMERIMKKNGNGTFLGKAVVASVTLVCMFSGNVVAKAADVPVNMLFSENVKVAEIGEYEELEIGEYEEVELGEFEILEEADYKEDSFEAHDMKTVEENYTLLTTDELADASYEMVYEGVWQKVAAPENSQADAKHAHQFVSTTLKKHVKNSDGSCTTTYYDGKKCTGCDTVWIGDLIRTVTDTVCTH